MATQATIHVHTDTGRTVGVWIEGLPSDWTDYDVRIWIEGLAREGNPVAIQACKAVGSGWVDMCDTPRDSRGLRVHGRERVYLDC